MISQNKPETMSATTSKYWLSCRVFVRRSMPTSAIRLRGITRVLSRPIGRNRPDNTNLFLTVMEETNVRILIKWINPLGGIFFPEIKSCWKERIINFIRDTKSQPMIMRKKSRLQMRLVTSKLYQEYIYIYIYIYIYMCVCVCVCVCVRSGNVVTESFLDENIFFFNTRIIFKKNTLIFHRSGFSDYCLHLYCYIHNVPTDISFDLLLVFLVELWSLNATSNHVLLFNPRGSLALIPLTTTEDKC